jgi:hypothetical protein
MAYRHPAVFSRLMEILTESIAAQRLQGHLGCELGYRAKLYPQPAKALSERIGTVLINGSWFVRRLQRLAGRAVIMHGHRHVDWIGECGGILIVSAPSLVIEATDCLDAYFYVHTLGVDTDGRLRLLEPERINVSDRQIADEAWTY